MGGEGVPAAVLADDDLLLPRLVSRIAELEQQLYGTPNETHESREAEAGLLNRFKAALRLAAMGIDASLSFM